MVTGRLTKPLPLGLLRGRAGPALTMWSQQKQARIKDFKAAKHKHHTQALSETSPVMWLQARCTQTGRLAGTHGCCPRQFWSAANQGISLPLSLPFWGVRPPPRLAEHLLLSNMPTRSPRRHNRLFIHTHSAPPSLSISPCQVGPNTCPLSRKHRELPASPS